MITYLHQKFHTNIQKLEHKNRLDSILIAISGGQDSLCLIKLIKDFKTYYSPWLRVNYIYIDHQWKKDSKQQLKHLINLISNQDNIWIYQIKNIIPSESEARYIRYQIIIKHALQKKNSIIMTAHTETDRVETFWQQLIRGTSIDGATSLTLHRLINPSLHLCRPLINFTRLEIAWFCRRYCLPIWSDITNYEYKIKRNRLRYELIPYLSKYFWVNIEKKISHFLQISAIENEYMKQNAIKLYLISCHQKNLALNYKILHEQHVALQSRTLQVFFYHNFNKCLSIKTLENILLYIRNIHDSNEIKMINWNYLSIQISEEWLYIY